MGCFPFSPLDDWKKLQKYYSRMSAEDQLDLLREENLRNIKDNPEGCISTGSLSKADKSLLKGENGPFGEDPNVNTGEEIERGSSKNTLKVDGTVINSIRRKSKKEDAVLLKQEDQITSAYTAFTFHDRCSFETSVFDIKSVSSELSGVGFYKTKATNSEIEEFEKNIENSRLSIGDVSPNRGLIHTDLQTETDEETKIMIINDKEEKQLPKNEVPFKDLLKEMNEEYNKEIVNIKERSTINKENNKKDILKNESKDSYYEIAITKEKEIIDDRKSQDLNSTSKNIFSSGKQLMQRFIKWSFDCYEMSSYNYDISSPYNYLHSVSKQLTK